MEAWFTLGMIEDALRGVLSIRGIEVVRLSRPEDNTSVSLLIRRAPHHYWTVIVPLTLDEQRSSDVDPIVHRILEHVDARLADRANPDVS